MVVLQTQHFAIQLLRIQKIEPVFPDPLCVWVLSKLLKVRILAWDLASLHNVYIGHNFVVISFKCVQLHATVFHIHIWQKKLGLKINRTWKPFESPLTFLILPSILYWKAERDWLAPSQRTLWFVSSLWKFVVNFAFCFFFSTLFHCSLPLCLEVSCSKKKRYYFPVEINPGPLMKRTIHNIGLELI